MCVYICTCVARRVGECCPEPDYTWNNVATSLCLLSIHPLRSHPSIPFTVIPHPPSSQSSPIHPLHRTAFSCHVRLLCPVDFEGLPDHRLLEHPQRAKGPPRKPPSQSRLAVSVTAASVSSHMYAADCSGVYERLHSMLWAWDVLSFTILFDGAISCCGSRRRLFSLSNHLLMTYILHLSVFSCPHASSASSRHSSYLHFTSLYSLSPPPSSSLSPLFPTLPLLSPVQEGKSPEAEEEPPVVSDSVCYPVFYPLNTLPFAACTGHCDLL